LHGLLNEGIYIDSECRGIKLLEFKLGIP